MRGYIPKHKLRIDSSTGENGDKKIANNYDDVTVDTAQENTDREIISMYIEKHAG